jgi:hypothetical protein
LFLVRYSGLPILSLRLFRNKWFLIECSRFHIATHHKHHSLHHRLVVHLAHTTLHVPVRLGSLTAFRVLVSAVLAGALNTKLALNLRVQVYAFVPVRTSREVLAVLRWVNERAVFG